MSCILDSYLLILYKVWGWSGGAKVLCILHHWGVQLILAYSWARPAILVVGKGRGGNVFISSVSSLSFLFLFLPCPSLSSPLLSLLSLFSLSLGDDTKWPSRVDVSLNPNTINLYKVYINIIKTTLKYIHTIIELINFVASSEPVYENNKFYLPPSDDLDQSVQGLCSAVSE